MKATDKYIEENKDRFLDELFELIRIPSISSESAHKQDMIRCAECWRDNLLKAGADKAEVMPTDGVAIGRHYLGLVGASLQQVVAPALGTTDHVLLVR